MSGGRQPGSELTLFHFNADVPSFEELAERNGTNWWRSSDLRDALGYDNDAVFEKVIRKAQQACLALNIATEDNFSREMIVEDGAQRREYKLTRFACYLVAMNGDPRKRQVAAAQAYFATLAQSFQDAIADAENLDRVVIRQELAAGEKTLSGTAQSHGVQNFAFFRSAGYRGMYNMNLHQLMRRKGVPEGKTLADYMGRRELAANLFRVTQTEEKIRRENVRGQNALERTAEAVGKKVRQTMMEIGGTAPEDLPAREPIPQVEAGLRNTSRKFKSLKDPRRAENDGE